MPTLTSRFEEALVYASQLHAAQVRKGGTGTPYVAHLLGVASIVLEHGGDEDEAIAALLHDAVEDRPAGGATSEQIRRRFGERVHRIVLALTDSDPNARDGEPKEDWRARKERFLERLRHEPAEVLRVAAADKLYNAWAILGEVRESGNAAFERFNARRDEQLWYYARLLEVFRAAGDRAPRRLVDELERVVTRIERMTGEHPTAERD
ncbi:MAG TPA: HD domain-containing protein [Gemmatimonadales bacterium]|nr:HD domain-containing protein [Gemmatimonadales bacterium]